MIFSLDLTHRICDAEWVFDSAAVVLEIDGQCREFSHAVVASIMGDPNVPSEIVYDHVLILRDHGVTLLAIPWPPGTTLDAALLAWAQTVER